MSTHEEKKMHGQIHFYKNMFDFYIECKVGFYGHPTRCKKCPPPSYGAGCQSTCNCRHDLCNHITGCFVTVSENGIYQFI